MLSLLAGPETYISFSSNPLSTNKLELNEISAILLQTWKHIFNGVAKAGTCYTLESRSISYFLQNVERRTDNGLGSSGESALVRRSFAGLGHLLRGDSCQT